MRTGLALALMLVIGAAIGLGVPMGAGAPAHLARQTQPEASSLAAPAGERIGGGEGNLAGQHGIGSPGDAAQGDVALARQPDGHFYAEVAIEGIPLRMLVDTGASVIALTGQDAVALGLQWDEADVAPIAQGAGGPVRGVRVVLPRVDLGGMEAEDISAIIVPEGLQVSLLGQSFLSRIGQVAISGDRLTLSGAREGAGAYEGADARQARGDDRMAALAAGARMIWAPARAGRA